MTPEEALKGLISIIGTGGIAGGLIAYYGYHKEALAGRKGDPANRLPGLLAGGFEPERTVEPLVNAISTLTAAIGSMTLLLKQKEERIVRETEEQEERERDEELRRLHDEVAALKRARDL